MCERTSSLTDSIQEYTKNIHHESVREPVVSQAVYKNIQRIYTMKV